MVYHIKVRFLMRISNIIGNFLHKSRIKSEKSLPILKNEGQSLCQDCVEIGVESGYFVPRKLFFTGMCTGYWLVVWWNTLMDWQWVKAGTKSFISCCIGECLPMFYSPPPLCRPKSS